MLTTPPSVCMIMIYSIGGVVTYNCKLVPLLYICLSSTVLPRVFVVSTAVSLVYWHFRDEAPFTGVK